MTIGRLIIHSWAPGDRQHPVNCQQLIKDTVPIHTGLLAVDMLALQPGSHLGPINYWLGYSTETLSKMQFSKLQFGKLAVLPGACECHCVGLEWFG